MTFHLGRPWKSFSGRTEGYRGTTIGEGCWWGSPPVTLDLAHCTWEGMCTPFQQDRRKKSEIRIWTINNRAARESPGETNINKLFHFISPGRMINFLRSIKHEHITRIHHTRGEGEGRKSWTYFIFAFACHFFSPFCSRFLSYWWKYLTSGSGGHFEGSLLFPGRVICFCELWLTTIDSRWFFCVCLDSRLWASVVIDRFCRVLSSY